MIYWIKYFIWVACLTIIFTTLLWFYSPPALRQTEFYSPLPQFLNHAQNKQVSELDLWLPKIAQTYADEVLPLTAKSALMYDLTENKVLFAKNTQAEMPMASLTKIMTAIIALENPKPGDRYVVRKDDIVGEDSMGLEEGEVLSLKELLYGLFLNSGNDAAEVLAHNYKDGRTAFVQAMNDKAKALGLSHTRFSNPSGLQGDGIQFTTAYDLLVITRFALETFPEISEVSVYEHHIPQTATHKAYDLYNETNLLTTYPGVKGLKTGYTPEAGLCLVTYYEGIDHKIIGIILNSENRRQEMKDLLDYSLTSLGIKPPPHE